LLLYEVIEWVRLQAVAWMVMVVPVIVVVMILRWEGVHIVVDMCNIVMPFVAIVYDVIFLHFLIRDNFVLDRLGSVALSISLGFSVKGFGFSLVYYLPFYIKRFIGRLSIVFMVVP
jgi:hypothetical protein